MTQKEAEDILFATEDGGVYIGPITKDNVCLDGDFSRKELEAALFLMKTKE